ncbi:hypothetical protein PoB_001174400 [Plakobranchus ocellatus]|uniref:Uncharacterized protein n=1 Tax=Plakobranchus ocellatus TaxID=259542 RepID=A0AAV3YTH4_9GAST|nr:hypothetical protein PoB_001174400 [Plakobranchus ocellatus]
MLARSVLKTGGFKIFPDVAVKTSLDQRLGLEYWTLGDDFISSAYLEHTVCTRSPGSQREPHLENTGLNSKHGCVDSHHAWSWSSAKNLETKTR